MIMSAIILTAYQSVFLNVITMAAIQFFSYDGHCITIAAQCA